MVWEAMELEVAQVTAWSSMRSEVSDIVNDIFSPLVRYEVTACKEEDKAKEQSCCNME